MRFIKTQFQKFLEWKITETELRASLAHMSSGEHTVIIGQTVSNTWYVNYDMATVCLGNREHHHRT